jgi:hypothetical protein
MNERRAFGTDVIASAPVVSGARATHANDRRREPRRTRFLGRALSALAWVLFCAAAVAVYTNVLADDSALRERTEALARQHAGCGHECRITQMMGSRSVVAFQADYDIEGSGTVHVVCRRAAIVAGEHECTAR